MLSLSRIKDRLFYGWVVVTAVFAINAIIFGTRYSFGIFFKSIEGEFDLSRAATSGVFSVYMVLSPVFAVLGGWALDRYGPRRITFLMGLFTGLSLLLTSQVSSPWQLLITYSLLLAIGTGAAYIVMMSTVVRWFDKKRGLALGIAGSGVGLGTVVMAPFVTYLIVNSDWRTAYIVMGLIAGLVVIFSSMLLRKDPSKIGVLPDGVKPDADRIGSKDEQDGTQPVSLSLLQALRTRNFWFLGITWLMWSLCLHLVLTHIVPHATDIGISAIDAAIVFSLISMASIPGRLIMGEVSDRVGRRASAIICALLQAGAMVWLIWAQDLWMFYLFALVYGFGYGGLDPSTLALVGEMFGLRNIGVTMGALAVGWGIGAAIGPVVGGLIFDASQSYFTAFLIGAFAMLAATLFVALTKRETNGNI